MLRATERVLTGVSACPIWGLAFDLTERRGEYWTTASRHFEIARSTLGRKRRSLTAVTGFRSRGIPNQERNIRQSNVDPAFRGSFPVFRFAPRTAHLASRR